MIRAIIVILLIGEERERFVEHIRERFVEHILATQSHRGSCLGDLDVDICFNLSRMIDEDCSLHPR